MYYLATWHFIFLFWKNGDYKSTYLSEFFWELQEKHWSWWEAHSKTLRRELWILLLLLVQSFPQLFVQSLWFYIHAWGYYFVLDWAICTLRTLLYLYTICSLFLNINWILIRKREKCIIINVTFDRVRNSGKIENLRKAYWNYNMS